jgi:hypothetical protein
VTKGQATAKTKPGTPHLPLRPAGLSTRWTVFQVLREDENADVRSALTADDLPCPSDDVLGAMRVRYVPMGFTLKSPRSAALLAQLGIASFVQNTDEAKEARALLGQPRARELVEAGLIAGVPAKAIVQTLQMYLQYEVSPEVIGLYASAFFDTNAVSRSQLRPLVQARVRIAVGRVSDPEDDVTVQRAIASDARTVAMSLPSSPLSWASILMAAGHAPGRHDLALVIGHIENVATLRVAESLLRGSPGDERRAESFASVLRTIREIRETVATPSEELGKKLMSFRIQHEVRPMPTMAQLMESGDQVAVDFGPPLTDAEGA